MTGDLAVSLDGFVAGSHQSLDDPVGRGGMRLHSGYQEPEVEQDSDCSGNRRAALRRGAADETVRVEVVASPHVTHVKYRIVRSAGDESVGSIK